MRKNALVKIVGMASIKAVVIAAQKVSVKGHRNGLAWARVLRQAQHERSCGLKFRCNYSNGTPGICFAVRIVKLVFTLATLGAGVSLLVRNS